jgi:hypothetical protein
LFVIVVITVSMVVWFMTVVCEKEFLVCVELTNGGAGDLPFPDTFQSGKGKLGLGVDPEDALALPLPEGFIPPLALTPLAVPFVLFPVALLVPVAFLAVPLVAVAFGRAVALATVLLPLAADLLAAAAIAGAFVTGAAVGTLVTGAMVVAGA